MEHSLKLSDDGLDGSGELLLGVLWESFGGLLECLEISLGGSICNTTGLIFGKTELLGGLLGFLLQLPLLVLREISSNVQAFLLSEGGLWGTFSGTGTFTFSGTCTGTCTGTTSWALSTFSSISLPLEALDGSPCDFLEAIFDFLIVSSHFSSKISEGCTEIGKIVLGSAFGISLEGSSSENFVDGINFICVEANVGEDTSGSIAEAQATLFTKVLNCEGSDVLEINITESLKLSLLECSLVGGSIGGSGGGFLNDSEMGESDGKGGSDKGKVCESLHL